MASAFDYSPPGLRSGSLTVTGQCGPPLPDGMRQIMHLSLHQTSETNTGLPPIIISARNSTHGSQFSPPRTKRLALMLNGGQSSSVSKNEIASARKFYAFHPDVTGGGRGHGLVFVNEDKLLSPPRIIVRPEEGVFPPLSEKPHIAYDPKTGDAPRDLEGGMSGHWFVSERLKQVFETVDPEGFSFAEYDFTLPDRSRGPTHYLCDVLRVLDVLDEDHSRMKAPTIYPGGEKVYDFAGQPSLSFKEKAIGQGNDGRRGI